MTQTIRIAAFCVFCVLGFTACGFFGEEHSEIPGSKRAAAPVRSASVSSYPSTAEQWVNLSRSLYQEGKYLESIGASQTALHLKPEFAEHNVGRPKGVGLNHIRTDSQVLAVDIAYHFGTTEVQHFATVFFSPEVVKGGPHILNERAHGAVVDDNALIHGL